MKKTLLALVAIAFSSGALAQTTVPFTFSAGSTAKASEVNADFQALATAIDSLATRVTKLEGQFTSADIQGAVYSAHRIEIGFGNVPITTHDSYTGTVTLNSNGTMAMAQTDVYYNNSGTQGSATVNKIVTPGNYNGTWSLTGQVLSLVFTGAITVTLDCVSGGRLCVGNTTNDSGGGVQIFILLRTN